MNLCTFVGRVTKDPEIRYSQDSQMAIAKFVLAVDRNYKAEEGGESADFFPCVAFDKRAEFAERHLYKGIRIAINGKMRNNNYTNRNGEKVYGNSLYVDNIEFADGKREEGPDLPAEAAAARPAQGAGQTSGAGMSRQAGRSAAAGTGQPARAGRAAAQASKAGAATQTSRAGTAGAAGQTSRAAAAQGTSQAGARSTAAGQRTAASRSAARGAASGTGAAGRSGAAGNTAARAASAYGDGFMSIPDGIEDEGLPFH